MKRSLVKFAGVCFPWLVAASVNAGLVPKRSVLENGIILLTSEQKALPAVSVEILIDAGSRLDSDPQPGLANLTARLLIYGTQRRSASEISETLDFLGASLTTGCAADLASISMTILKKDLETGLALLAEIVTASTFPKDEVDRQKQSVIASLRAQQENPGEIAYRKFSASLFPQSPYGKPVEGTETSVKSLEQKSLREFFDRYYRPNRTLISVVGDISGAEIIQALSQAFRSWKMGAAGGGFPVPRVIGSPQSLTVNKDLAQANIMMGHAGVPRDHPDYYAIQVMNYILGGGGFSSRAMDAIRNERGLAYSVYSYFSAKKSHGTFAFVMQTKNETAREAIRLAREEIRRMRENPVSDRELQDAKDYLTGSFPLRLDTNPKVASFLAQAEFFQLGLDYPDRYTDLIQEVSREDVQRVARQYLHPEQLITVIVGNQKKIGEK